MAQEKESNLGDGEGTFSTNGMECGQGLRVDKVPHADRSEPIGNVCGVLRGVSSHRTVSMKPLSVVRCIRVLEFEIGFVTRAVCD